MVYAFRFKLQNPGPSLSKSSGLIFANIEYFDVAALF